MKFRYTALGLDSQKLTGTLESDSLESAREKLHKMGTSIISIEEAFDDLPASQPMDTPEEVVNRPDDKGDKEVIKTYYFEAKDGADKLINGTIDAKDGFSAYKRLISEYQFIVQELKEGEDGSSGVSLSADFNSWNQLLTEEGFDLNPNTKNSNDEDDQMAEEVVSEIDRFVVSTKKILEAHQSQYSKEFLLEIESKLANLERIRSSTNLNHITKVCNDLYRLISHPTFDTNETASESKEELNEGEEYKDILEKLKTSGFVENKFKFLDKYKLKKNKARFGKIQSLFAGIQSKLTNTQKKSTQERLKEIKKTEARMNASNGINITSLKPVIFTFFAYLFESNKILRRIKKQEFNQALSEWRTNRDEHRKTRKDKVGASVVTNNTKKDLTPFFLEIDSFIGWLLFFYLSFFFLVSFSLERSIGFSQELIVSILSEPHIINISIFLILFHLTLKLKIRLFRQNIFGSSFLFFFSLSIYTLLISNF